jgi:peptidoglycan hydrolase-like protein with peptidoglycan-binding domain
MRPLKLNCYGDDVAKWQQFLIDAGFKPGTADGSFGPATEAATMAFQKKRGLTADGVVGNETFGKAMTLGFKPLPEHDDEPADTSTSVVTTIAGVKVNKLGDGSAVFYTAGMMIDADGAYRAYHPGNKGLDYLANGGKPGNWWALVTDNGRPSGEPIVQGPNDPAPGFYISTTSLEDANFNRKDPRRYVDSETIPYIVLPGGKLGGAKLGDLALLINLETKTQVKAIVADAGPPKKLGEASIATAAALLGPGKGNPKNGGTERKIIRYIVFSGSGDGRPKTAVEIVARVDGLLHALSKEQVIAVCG